MARILDFIGTEWKPDVTLPVTLDVDVSIPIPILDIARPGFDKLGIRFRY